QRDLLPHLLIHHPWPLPSRHRGHPARHRLLGGMKRRAPMIRKGEDALAASRLPPVTTQANRHRPSTAQPGSPAAAVNAAPIAATADRSRSGSSRTTSPPSSTASAEKLTARSPARAANRRTQPRAVLCRPPPPAPARPTPPHPA